MPLRLREGAEASSAQRIVVFVSATEDVSFILSCISVFCCCSEDKSHFKTASGLEDGARLCRLLRLNAETLVLLQMKRPVSDNL